METMILSAMAVSQSPRPRRRRRSDQRLASELGRSTGFGFASPVNRDRPEHPPDIPDGAQADGCHPGGKGLRRRQVLSLVRQLAGGLGLTRKPPTERRGGSGQGGSDQGAGQSP